MLSASIVYGVVQLTIFLRGLHRKVEALRALNIERRLNTMGRSWMDPNELYLFAQRVLSGEKK